METTETDCRDVANILFGRYIEGKADKLLVMALLSVLLDIYFLLTSHSGQYRLEKVVFFRYVHLIVLTKKKHTPVQVVNRFWANKT
jgi:hypothetical protein